MISAFTRGLGCGRAWANLAMTVGAGILPKALVLVVLLANAVLCCVSEAGLKGGCGKVNITPPVGIGLIGSYGKPSDDILDELYVRALVLDDGGDYRRDCLCGFALHSFGGNYGSGAADDK